LSTKRQSFKYQLQYPYTIPSFYAIFPSRYSSSPKEEIGGHVWHTTTSINTIKRIAPAFELTSKRKRGYPSESAVKRGLRIVHGEKDLCEKLGKEDLCPCGSARSFQALLPQ
jgi:hypothetical protein